MFPPTYVLYIYTFINFLLPLRFSFFMFFIQHISSAAPNFLLRRWNRTRSRICIDTLAVSHDNHSALSDPHIFVSTIPHWLLPTVRDLTRDSRWSTYLRCKCSQDGQCLLPGKMCTHGKHTKDTITNKTRPAGSFSSS